MTLFEQHTVPHPSSSDNSDSEDLYGGFDTDELHPSSDSELVSHPSDSEGHGRSLSVSPVPAYAAIVPTHNLEAYGESDGDTEDEDQRLPSSSFSSQDFDQRFLPRRRRETKEQDDFLLVEPPSRPHSSLSNHSDPMSLVFPSMVLSQPSKAPALHGGDAQQVAVDKVSRQDTLHTPPAHDIPTTVESGLEMLSGTPQPAVTHSEEADQNQISNNDQEKDRANNDSTDDSTPLAGTVELAPAHALVAEDRGPGGNAQHGVDSAQSVPNLHDVELSEATQEKPGEEEGSTEARSSASIRHLFDHLSHRLTRTGVSPGLVSINPSWSVVNVLAGCLGFLSMLVFTVYLTAEYHHYSVQPAHVVVSKINYSGQSLAVVNLQVYTSRLTQEQRPNRPPGFHIRVLNDNKPWSLEEAPAQPLHLFAEPIISCVRGGYCYVYIPSHQRRTHKGQSPWLCSDTSYYLHIWFANGTRVPQTPPEIFTSRGERGSKPRECFSRPLSTQYIAEQGDEDDVYDDYLAYWKDQIQHLAETVTEGYSALSISWATMWWDRLQPAISELQDLVQVAYDFFQYSAQMVTAALQQWKTLVVTHVNVPMDNANAVLMRAQENAKKLKSQVSSKLQHLSDGIHGQATFKGKEQSSPFSKKTLKDQLDRMSAKKALRKADKLLHRAERFLADVEDSVDSWVADKVDVDEIKRQADRLAFKAEAKIEQALDSKIARKINRNMKRKLGQFKTTPTGNKLLREASEAKQDVERRWRDLRRHLGHW